MQNSHCKAKNISKKKRNKVNLDNITWGYEALNGIKSPSIIEDFDAMSQFDCLIRSHSNFSIAASLLGNHKIIITPTNAQWVNKETLLIDDISIIVHNLKLNIN